MEGNKNAMYVEAGRIRGWQVVPAEVPAAAPTPVPMPAPMPAPMPTPITEVIPAPPVVVMPEADIPLKGCQELAMAYVKMQKWQKIHEPEKGFERGTLFAELDLPFVGEGDCRHG